MNRVQGAYKQQEAARPPVRSRGRGRILMGKKGLDELHQSGCIRLLLPRSDHGVPEAVVVNTAGGLTGGDDIDVQAGCTEGAILCLSSQSAERIYRSSEGVARVRGRLKVADGAFLEWIPRETILFDKCGLDRHVDVELAETARFLFLDVMVLGRHAMGENLSRVQVNDQRRVWRNGRLVFADGFRLHSGMLEMARSRAGIGDSRAVGSFFYTGADADLRAGSVRAGMEGLNVDLAVSCWNNMIFARFLSADPQAVLAGSVRMLENFRGRPVPHVWKV